MSTSESGAVEGERPAASLRVVQLNIGSLLEPGWLERRHEIVAWLVRLEPDVVCLQEVWEDDNTPNTAGWIADQMPELGWHWHFGGRPFIGQPFGARIRTDRGLRFGSAVLSRWPIDASAYHALPVDDADPDPFVRAIPWELVQVRTAGLDVFSCHLAPAPRHGLHRRLQVLAIDDIITGTGRPGSESPGDARRAMPPILCGDFNAEPASDEIRFLSSLAVIDGRTTYYQDAWRVAGADGPGYTQDWRTNPIAGTLNVPRKRIDYVFVGDAFMKPNAAGRVLSAAVAFDEPLTGTMASDHKGLVVDITWPTRPT